MKKGIIIASLLFMASAMVVFAVTVKHPVALLKRTFPFASVPAPTQPISLPDQLTTTTKPVSVNGSVVLPASVWVPQTFNNCVPASTSMLLQHFGYQVSQADLKAMLRTNPDDRNVFTYEVSDLLKKKYNVDSKLLYNGDVQRIKTLVDNGFYVFVESFLHATDDIGHALIIRGYDDTKKVFIADDSFVKVGRELPYQDFDQKQWKAFNREYMPVYAPANEGLVRSIIGADWDKTAMYTRSVQTNEAAVAADPKDAYSWFNLGSSYYHLGEYQQAKQAFDTSRGLGWPARMLWYQYDPIKNDNAMGAYQQALDLIALGLKNNNSYAELHYEAAVAYRGLGQIAKALQEVKLSIQLAPQYQPALALKTELEQ